MNKDADNNDYSQQFETVPVTGPELFGIVIFANAKIRELWNKVLGEPWEDFTLIVTRRQEEENNQNRC